MSSQELWQGCRRSLVTVVVFLVVGIALAITYLALAPKSYTSSAGVFITASDDSGTLTQNAQGASLVKNSIGSYAQLVTSPAVLDAAAAMLGIPEGHLQSQVTAVNPLNTTLLDISVRNSSASLAKTYADAVTKGSVSAIEALQSSAGSAARSPVKLTVVSPATVPTSPTTPDRTLAFVLGALSGLGLGLAVAGGRGKFAPPERVEPAPEPTALARNELPTTRATTG